MKKEILEKAKEKTYEMAVKDVNDGKYSIEHLNVINMALSEIRTKEFEKEQEKTKAEREKANKDYAEMLARILNK